MELSKLPLLIVNDTQKYKLFSVVHYVGPSVVQQAKDKNCGTGHFMSIALQDDSWVMYDDKSQNPMAVEASASCRPSTNLMYFKCKWPDQPLVNTKSQYFSKLKY